MSEDREERVPVEVTVVKDPERQPGTDRFLRVYWNHGSATVGVNEDVVAALCANDAEADPFENGDGFLAGQARQPRYQEEIVTL